MLQIRASVHIYASVHQLQLLTSHDYYTLFIYAIIV